MRIRRFLRDRRGATAVVTALCFVSLLGFVGFATDVGAVYLQSRRLQGAADLAALAAAQAPERGQALAAATVNANNWPSDTQVQVQTGRYTPSRAIAPQSRFAAGAEPNAVRVQLTAWTPLYFGRFFVPEGRMRLVRRATASQSRLVSFQIGSRLLSLNGGLANDVLSGLTGSNVSLSVMDYNALLSADVDLLEYVSALRTRMNLQAATFDQTLSTRTDAPEALHALADALALSDHRAEAAMRKLAQAASTSRSIAGLDEVIDLGPYADQDDAQSIGATAIRVNAMDLASAVLQIAGGDRQVRLQTASALPGLANTNVWLAIGERPNHSPWLSVTDDSDVIVRTAQMRLYIETEIRPGGALGVAAVRAPLLVEAASAQARLSDATCGFNASDRSATLLVAPSIGSLTLGEIDTAQLDNFRTTLRPAPAELVRLGLVRVEGEGRIELGGQNWQSVRFNSRDIENGAVKTVATRDAAQATLTSLLGRTRITVRAGGLGLTTPALGAATQTALIAVGPALDGLVNSLSDLLGVHLGEADVRVNGLRCGGAALVG